MSACNFLSRRCQPKETKFFCTAKCSQKGIGISSFLMITFDHEFMIPWNDDDDDDDDDDGSEHWPSAASSTMVPTIKAEDRINIAAVSAWSHIRDSAGLVLGGMAYDNLKDLYFRLRRHLHQHGKRTSFTKEECANLLLILSSEAMPARERRQPAQQLNTHLKAVLAKSPYFRLSELQEAAKKCATMVASLCD
jgi:hypothetical protein